MATWPVWPPASVPWATTRSQPASTARTAWLDLAAHVDDEHPVLVAQVDDVGGHAEAGHEDAGAALDDQLRPGRPGRPAWRSAGRRRTGLSVAARTAAISATIARGPSSRRPGSRNPRPRTPPPPAGRRTPRPCRPASPGARSRAARSVVSHGVVPSPVCPMAGER